MKILWHYWLHIAHRGNKQLNSAEVKFQNKRNYVVIDALENYSFIVEKLKSYVRPLKSENCLQKYFQSVFKSKTRSCKDELVSAKNQIIVAQEATQYLQIKAAEQGDKICRVEK